MVLVIDILTSKYGRCPVKGCDEAAVEKHHILYEYHKGGPVIRGLCTEHHAWITRRQSHAARRQHGELSQKQRWFFWKELVDGKMKRPRRTRLDSEWTKGR
jgi:hypothetical protein